MIHLLSGAVPHFLQTRSHCAEKLEVCGVAGIEVQEDQRRLVGGQTFFQAPHRESVIFFSTGKTLSKAPIFEKQESSARRKQHDPALPVHKEVPPESVPTCGIEPPVARLHRGNGHLMTMNLPILYLLCSV